MDIRCLQMIINLYACKNTIKEANDIRPKYSTKRSSKEPQICYCETGPMPDDRKSEAPRPCLPTGRHRAGLPGNVDSITGSALTPLRESVSALPAPAYWQEGGASSRLARENISRSS
jgi:hypothetical protein